MNRANNTLRTISAQVCCVHSYLESCDPVAQLDRVLDSESRGHAFESRRDHQLSSYFLDTCGYKLQAINKSHFSYL
jgi:hypothetical protein